MIPGSLEGAHRSSPFYQSRRSKGTVGTLLASWVNRLIAWFEARRRIRRAVDELMALDDRTLADIGLTRGEILYAVRHGRERDR
jgi:uncharacterized protein YjiS (DUF1127 family)